MLQDFELERLVEPLLAWFADHARVLPWREEPTPYRVWVSEIMLQQTRVEAVKPYFERFVTELPDVAALAACPEDKLLKLWEGLGYYNRVRNMQKAAATVMEEHGGVLPADYGKLLSLKGIGSYTAGAIASIAYGISVPAVDGNVLRIITRAAADDTDIMKQSFRNEVERRLLAVMQELTVSDAVEEALLRRMPGLEDANAQEEALPRRMHGLEATNAQGKAFSGRMKDALPEEKRHGANLSGALNQALMELGATVCVPNGAPLCEQCPWRDLCLARKEHKIDVLPVKSKAKARKIEERTVFIIRDGDKVAIRKRPAKGLLAGLYELPNALGKLAPDEALAFVKEQGLAPLRVEKLTDAKHIFSHIEWHMTGYAILVEEAGFAEEEGVSSEEKLLFVDVEDAGERYAIPSAFAAYAQYMKLRLGKDGF